MDTLVTRYPVAFTGADVAALPVIAQALPTLGIDTYSHRWIVSRSSLADSTAIDTLANQVAGAPALLQATAGKRPLIKRTANDAWIDFDGVDDVLQLASFAPTTGITVAMVARVQSTAFSTLVNLQNTGQTDMQMVSQPQAGSAKFDIRANPTTRLALSDTTKNPGDGNWHFLAGTFNGATSAAVFDTVGTSGAIGTGFASRLSFGDTNMGAVGGVPTNYDVAEIVVWSTPLTAAQLTGTVYPAMKANHPTLLV